MSKLIELKLKKSALQKKIDLIESELELIYYQIDDIMEENTYEVETERESSGGMYFNKEQMHKLLCFLEYSIIPSKEGFLNDNERKSLIDFQYDLMCDVAEQYDYDIEEGTIHPSDYQYITFKELNKQSK